MNNAVLIIPDVHGRKFWKEAVRKYPFIDTIFLGDYHDPYPDEGISEEESLENFKEILNYARQHPNCHLLLGNHDLHYLCNFGEGCRLDYENSAEIHSLLLDNLDLFQILTAREISGKMVVFTHAPILREWFEMTEQTDNLAALQDTLNELLPSIALDPYKTEKLLGFISPYRGGYDIVGSPIWADVREIEEDNLIPTADYSIFAHTQAKEPIITDRWADLDCRQAFLLTPGLKLTPIE